MPNWWGKDISKAASGRERLSPGLCQTRSPSRRRVAHNRRKYKLDRADCRNAVRIFSRSKMFHGGAAGELSAPPGYLLVFSHSSMERLGDASLPKCPCEVS